MTDAQFKLLMMQLNRIRVATEELARITDRVGDAELTRLQKEQLDEFEYCP